MQKLICTACFLFLFSVGAIAQNSPDCRSAIPICADAPIMGLSDGNGDINDFDPDVIRQTGCLEKGSISEANIENNTSWFAFRALADGQIGFDIEALTTTAEWDFAVYGSEIEDDAVLDCVDISSGTEPIRCNYEVNTTGFTGIGVNPISGQNGQPPVDDVTEGNQNTYDTWMDVAEGEIYYILINNYNTNFDGNPEPFSLTFTNPPGSQDVNEILDCTFRDEFLGLDIIACEGDPDIVLSARRSPAGAVINSVVWELDSEDDGTYETPLTGSGAPDYELTVSYPNSGRYQVTITTPFTVITDDILITYYTTPVLDPDNGVTILDTNINPDYNFNDIEFVVDGDGDYEYAINGGEFQEDPIFLDVPPGENTVIINDLNGCGTTEPIPFLVVGYPKFFTPNADSRNDFWNIQGIETLTDPVVFIFDRYGKLLKQIDETTLGWDGTFNGRPMPSSDYWFRFEYSEPDDQNIIVAKTTRRHFSLVR
ncbi:T9SS type B sorting domain-containing protein [Costertonia aggregata]|uniref:T9SS type B sorting domain-containing protein n=1 Tax=Costertonia aggregata TaxID=343403 RepID=A0A7H9ARX1_9FLAO|nr:T9SS type B sorting domain-containing protein [Costertonia aggregata]QLG46190.1 T9SS type B sorting domain-containing protein [Costertonia aggregata]